MMHIWVLDIRLAFEYDLTYADNPLFEGARVIREFVDPIVQIGSLGNRSFYAIVECYICVVNC